MTRLSQLLLEAQLDVAKNKAQRIMAHRRFVEDAKTFERHTQQGVEDGIATRVDLWEAKAIRLKAEIQLTRERAED